MYGKQATLTFAEFILMSGLVNMHLHVAGEKKNKKTPQSRDAGEESKADLTGAVDDAGYCDHWTSTFHGRDEDEESKADLSGAVDTAGYCDHLDG